MVSWPEFNVSFFTSHALFRHFRRSGAQAQKLFRLIQLFSASFWLTGNCWFERIWAWLVYENEELGNVDWRWQAADGRLGQAPIGGDELGPPPTDRAKNGTQESLLGDRQGGPRSGVVAPAKIHDHLLLEETMEAIVVERPEPTEEEPQHLCLDAGYNHEPSKQVVKEHGYQGHIRPGGAETLDQNGKKKDPARRWGVERTVSWLLKCRGL